MLTKQHWSIYLSGEIHSDWRDCIQDGFMKDGLSVNILKPVVDHSSSDDCGVKFATCVDAFFPIVEPSSDVSDTSLSLSYNNVSTIFTPSSLLVSNCIGSFLLILSSVRFGLLPI